MAPTSILTLQRWEPLGGITLAHRDPCVVCGHPVLWPRMICKACEWADTVITQARWAISRLPLLDEVTLRGEALSQFDQLVTKLGFSPEDTLQPDQAMHLVQAGQTLVQDLFARESHELLMSAAYAQHEVALLLRYDHVWPVERANAEQGKCAYLIDLLLGRPRGSRKSELDPLTFALALEMAYLLMVGAGNIQRMKLSKLPITAGDLFHNQLSSPATEAHLQAAADWIGLDSRVDFTPEDPLLQSHLKERGLTLEQIGAAMGAGLEATLGFGLSEVRCLLSLMEPLMDEVVMVLPRATLVQSMETAGVSSSAAEALLSFFAFSNQIETDSDLLQRVTQLERKAFLPLRNEHVTLYLFGSQTVHLNLTAVWRMLERNAMLETHLPATAVPAVRKAAERSQKLHAERLELLTAHVWERAGLAQRKQGRLPQTRIVKVVTRDGVLPVKSAQGQPLGDLDVLAGNQAEREILIAECKLAGRRELTPKEFDGIERSRIVEELPRIQNRHTWVKLNQKAVAEFLGMDPSLDYQVRTIIVTEAPHFIRQHLEGVSEISHMSFWELVERWLPETYREYLSQAGIGDPG